nr:aminotransferase class IV [Phaeobacter sp. HF9A]
MIETFGYWPGRGVEDLSLHLARLARSADVFGLPFDADEAARRVDALSGHKALRCRMTLAPSGALALETAAMPAVADLWHFTFAAQRLDAEDLFLRHKTTRRALYDRVRADLPAGVDEVVFLNSRGEVCEGTITNIAITTTEGQRLTPPLSSGCLPGVMRQRLLEAGQLREAVLLPEDVAEAQQIHLLNALRGEIIARRV